MPPDDALSEMLLNQLKAPRLTLAESELAAFRIWRSLQSEADIKPRLDAYRRVLKM